MSWRLLVETVYTSFRKLTECYFETSYLFFTILLGRPTLLREQDRKMTIQRRIPSHLQAEYSLLHLQAEASLTDARTQYRQLVKLYHPDAGGHHAAFLALQQAYERVVEHLQPLR
jgi:DnaJ-class molecular chaperone